MARKKRDDNSNRDNYGYSKEALDALRVGEYRDFSGNRQAQYRSSSAQLNQVKELPVLKGMSHVNDDWASSRGRINTNHARTKYEQKIQHDPIGRALSQEDADIIANAAFDMLNGNYSAKEAARRVRGDVPLSEHGTLAAQTAAGIAGNYAKNKNWEQEYGKSLEQLIEDYSKDENALKGHMDRAARKGGDISKTLGSIYMNAYAKPVMGAKATINNLIDPESDKAKNSNKVARLTSDFSKSARDDVTKDMGFVGKGLYNLGTDIADRAAGRVFGPVGQAGLTAFRTAEDTVESLNDRGVDGRKAYGEGLISGSVDALLDVIGLEKNKYIKGLQKSGKLGKTVGGYAAAGAGEQFITSLVNQAVDLIANGKDSVFSINRDNYIKNGDSETKATMKAIGDEALTLAEQTGFGAGLGALMGGGAYSAEKGLGKLPSLFNKKTEPVDADIERAKAQQQEAVENIQDLQRQIPETPDNVPMDEANSAPEQPVNPAPTQPTNPVNKVPEQPIEPTPEQRQAESRAAVIQRLLDEEGEIVSKNRRGQAPVKALKGAELEEANAELASIDNEINALRGDIEQYKRDTWRGRIKLASQKKIKAAQEEIRRLEASKTPIKRRINGESTPVIEQIRNSDSVNSFKKRVKQIGKMTPEGKEIAKQVNAALDNYIETGDRDALYNLRDNLFQLHNMSKEIPEYAEGYGDIEDGIFGELTNSNSALGKALTEVKEFQDKNFVDIPEGERKTSQYYNNTMRNTDLNSEMDDAKYADIYDEDDYGYFTREEKRGISERRQHIAEVGEEAAISEVLNSEVNPENGAGFNADTLDQAHILAQRTLERARELEAQGLDASKEYRLAHRLHQKVQEGVTSSAQAMQANQKWIKQTAQGALDQLMSDINKNIDLGTSKGYSKDANRLANSVEDAIEDSTDEASLVNSIRKAFDRFRGKSFKNVDQYEQEVLDLINDPKNQQKNISELAEEAGKLLRKNLGVSSITAKEERAILNLLDQASAYEPGSRAYKLLESQAMKILDDTLPPSIPEKAKSLMYSNMLASLKTMVTRNAGGNVVANALENIATPFQVGADALMGLKTGSRSRTFSKNAVLKGMQGLKGSVKEWADDVKNKTNTTRSGQDDLKYVLAAVHNPFKTKSNNKVVQAINKAGGLYNYVIKKGMELGDRPIYEAKYAATKAELMDVIDKYGDEGIRRGLNIKKDANIDDVIEFIAVGEALESVLQNDSLMKEAAKNLKMTIKKASEDIIGVDVASMSTVPFLEVPANMVSRYFQYTPFGILSNAFRSWREYKGTGAVNQRRASGEIGRNILGGLMTAGGMFAADKLISGPLSEDPDEKKIQQMNGYQEYAVQTPDGSTQVDLSDIPVLGPKIRESKMLYDAWQAGGGGLEGIPELLKEITPAASSATVDTLFQGINKLSGGAGKYSASSLPKNAGDVMSNVYNAVASSIGSLTTPAFIRQTAQYSDRFKRDLGDYATAEYNKNLILNGLPVVRQNTLDPKIDTSGEYVKELNGQEGLGRLWNAYLAPWKISHPLDNMSDAQRYALELGEQIEGKAALPHVVNQSTLKGIKGYDKDNYTHDDLREISESYYDSSAKLADTLIRDQWFKNLSPEMQNTFLEEVYSNNLAAEKQKFVTKDMTPEQIEAAGKDIYSTDDRLAKIIMNDNDMHTGLFKYFHNKEGIINLAQKYGYQMDYNTYDKWNKDPELRDLGGPEAYAANYDKAKNLGFSGVKDYLEAEKYYEGGAVKKMQDKAKAKELGMQLDDYNKYEENYYGGATAKAADKEMLLDLGYVKKDGSVSTSHFDKMMEKAGPEYANEARAALPKLRELGLPDTADFTYVQRIKHDPGMTPNGFAKEWNAINTNGKGVSQDEIIAFANNNGLNLDQTMIYWDDYGDPKWKKVPFVMPNGQIGLQAK